ncbi:MAG TPA: HAD domain-containing protein [Noviherbaspirillum sp.]
MRVLFLEFDGVLHPASAAYRFAPGNSLRQSVLALWLFRWAWILDELLLPHPDIRIVTHSNWRLLASDEELKGVLGPLARRFVGTTPHGTKWSSILAIAQLNELHDYRILDAWPEVFPPDIPELIVCDTEAGLQDLRVQSQLASWLKCVV